MPKLDFLGRTFVLGATFFRGTKSPPLVCRNKTARLLFAGAKTNEDGQLGRDSELGVIRGIDVMRNWASYGAYLSLGLAAAALLLLVVSPLGWRAGWWHFRFAFFWLMPASGFIALAAAIVSLFVLAAGWPQLSWRGLTIAGIGLAAGAVLAYVPWQYNHRLTTLPRIHDVTTDTENPPTYVAALPARAAENAGPATYAGSEIAEQQKAAYPDLAPLKAGLPPEQAFPLALDTAKAMPGWTVVAADPAAGRIEARETSRWFRFTDDIVIRVAAETPGTRIDMRSESRQGRSDFGVNAKRIRAYMATLRQRLG